MQTGFFHRVAFIKSLIQNTKNTCLKTVEKHQKQYMENLTKKVKKHRKSVETHNTHIHTHTHIYMQIGVSPLRCFHGLMAELKGRLSAQRPLKLWHNTLLKRQSEHACLCVRACVHMCVFLEALAQHVTEAAK